MITCAIHQPNFFPWLPYFSKINEADVFVFLDDVAYPKSGNSMGSWVNRVKIDMHSQEVWLSCPVVREAGVQIIKEVQIKSDNSWQEERLQTLKHAYARSKNFSMVNDFLKELFNESSQYLAFWNSDCIMKIGKLLNVKTKFIRQSELNTQYSSTELLVEICKKVGATKYLSGNGAVAYQDEAIFKENNIDLEYQQINKANNFSIIHHLMHTDKAEWGLN